MKKTMLAINALREMRDKGGPFLGYCPGGVLITLEMIGFIEFLSCDLGGEIDFGYFITEKGSGYLNKIEEGE